MAEINDYLDLGERIHRDLTKPADYARNLADNGQASSTEYASDQLQYVAEDLSYEAGHIAVDMAKDTFRSVRKMHKHIQKQQKIDMVPRTAKIGSVQKADAAARQAAQANGKAMIKTAQKTIKDSQRAVKSSQEAAKASIKTAQETARATKETARVASTTARRTGELVREAAKAAAEAVKTAAKAIAAAAKAVAATVEEIGGAIAAGGWVALAIIAVIIIIFVITMAVVDYWQTVFMSPYSVPFCNFSMIHVPPTQFSSSLHILQQFPICFNF